MMIWSLASNLKPPKPWVRFCFDAGCVIIMAWLIYLAAFDTTPPYEPGARGRILETRVIPGSLQEVQWELVEQRRCAEVHIRRGLLSAAEPTWTLPLADAQAATWDNDPIPIARRILAQPFVIPPSMPIGGAFYRAEVIAACNWLQAMLPEAAWIHQRLPALMFTVSPKQQN